MRHWQLPCRRGMHDLCGGVLLRRWRVREGLRVCRRHVLCRGGHEQHVHVLRRRLVVRRWHERRGAVQLHTWLLLSGGCGYELCGYGGIVHDMHCRKFLRRGCRGARCV